MKTKLEGRKKNQVLLTYFFVHRQKDPLEDKRNLKLRRDINDLQHT